MHQPIVTDTLPLALVTSPEMAVGHAIRCGGQQWVQDGLMDGSNALWTD